MFRLEGPKHQPARSTLPDRHGGGRPASDGRRCPRAAITAKPPAALLCSTGMPVQHWHASGPGLRLVQADWQHQHTARPTARRATHRWYSEYSQAYSEYSKRYSEYSHYTADRTACNTPPQPRVQRHVPSRSLSCAVGPVVRVTDGQSFLPHCEYSVYPFEYSEYACEYSEYQRGPGGAQWPTSSLARTVSTLSTHVSTRSTSAGPVVRMADGQSCAHCEYSEYPCEYSEYR